jgi:hypothetical protein
VTYILSAQLDDETTRRSAYARYRAYIELVRDRMPAGAYVLATSDWYFSGTHRSPHDAWLEYVQIREERLEGEDRRRTSISIRLLGAYHDGWIDLDYADVTRYRIELWPDTDDNRGHRDWRYDEFRLSADGNVEHEIEWWDSQPTATWLIEAADIRYRWTPFNSRSGISDSSSR